MRKVIERCPACGGDLAVTHLQCGRCDTEVSGRFAPNPFDRLSPEGLAFVEVFVRLRGNVKEMERELGVPYSTVRGRLDEVIGELGFEAGAGTEDGDAPSQRGKRHGPRDAPRRRDARPGGDDERRQEILARLSDGAIDVEAAVDELEALTNERED